ncbi:flagellar biosynthesis anti-sigma factor FlgM [Pseudoxanthomonas sp.]|uniref:flagellar biosynthesis anti-sigma factor FlgM n=1 Tax=Pseudoxanthomonas sp. TaxID=1871049 RepID=UPI002625ECDE|nr:flagellar biosynthesis anti-sigma factor FlgM [Pseudoxanthomonas sp.]WDS36859.1 MAG: flagellar biosynthesis anti-sigma factor FlgM [Pseudoxanthomonas sp.]
MNQKIEGSLPGSALLRTSKTSATAWDGSSSAVVTDIPSISGDSLKLTGQAANLQALQRDLGQASPIDSSRVEAIRNSLQNGSYKIDPDAIASGMLSLDQQLSGSSAW